MCTVSIIPLRFASPRGHEPTAGFRLVTNRDESRARPAAAAPHWRDMGVHPRESPPAARPVRAVFPVDGVAVPVPGTWVAASESGLVLCLLNGNPRPYPELPPPDRLTSRGVIIPRLITAPDAASAASVVATLDLSSFAPFSLLAVDLAGPRPGACADGPRVFHVRWNGREVFCTQHIGVPVCEVSSGLGDDRVIPRIPHFHQMIAAGGVRPEVQDRFHRHVWPDRREMSVMMSRRDARTVSVTTVEVVAASHASPGRVSMSYRPVDDAGACGDPVVHRVAVRDPLPLTGGVRVPVVAV